MLHLRTTASASRPAGIARMRDTSAAAASKGDATPNRLGDSEIETRHCLDIAETSIFPLAANYSQWNNKRIE